MATIRKIRGKWQSIIRKKNYPHLARTFQDKSTARRWASESKKYGVEFIYEKTIFIRVSGFNVIFK